MSVTYSSPVSSAARTPLLATKPRSPRNRSTRPRAKKLVLCGACTEVRNHRRPGCPGEGASSKPARGGVYFHFLPFLLSGQVWAYILGGRVTGGKDSFRRKSFFIYSSARQSLTWLNKPKSAISWGGGTQNIMQPGAALASSFLTKGTLE